jgi:UDP-glucose:(heptosyl)LPS alpha-1,3-glucosyltransferase
VGNPKYQKYARLAQRFGIADHIRFVGHCADMRQAYFAADFLVHPTFYDPCSLVVLEGLACGLPIITSRFNGASELLVNGQEGFVIEDPNQIRKLAEVLDKLLDKETRHACSQASRRAGTKWTWENHYQILISLFAEISKNKRAA